MNNALLNLLPSGLKSAIALSRLALDSDEKDAVGQLLASVKSLPFVRQLPQELIPRNAEDLMTFVTHSSVNTALAHLPVGVRRVLNQPQVRQVLSKEVELFVEGLPSKNAVYSAAGKLARLVDPLLDVTEAASFAQFVDDVFLEKLLAIKESEVPVQNLVYTCSACGFTQLFTDHIGPVTCRACGHTKEI